MTPTEQIKEKIATLEAQLKEAHPNIATLLQTIHDTLKKDPEIVTLLDEDDIGIIVSGLSKHTAVEISAAALKSKTKSLKNITLTDL
jgi:hypothetical protein